jgi:hypothetical protein
MARRYSCGGLFGGAAKYKWLVLRIQEYPLNKALLRMEEEKVSPPGPRIMDAPSFSYISRPTEERAIRIAELKRRIEEVDRALEIIPEEYRDGVLYHTLHYGTRMISGVPGSVWGESIYDHAHKNTWKKWKTRFILEYARIIGELDHITMLNEYWLTEELLHRDAEEQSRSKDAFLN